MNENEAEALYLDSDLEPYRVVKVMDDGQIVVVHSSKENPLSRARVDSLWLDALMGDPSICLYVATHPASFPKALVKRAQSFLQTPEGHEEKRTRA